MDACCSDCKISSGVVADHSAGDTVCSKCGLVFESTVVSKPNGVTSDSNDGGLSTVNSKPNGVTSDLLSSSFETIATMSDRLGLVATINDRANEIYKKVEDKKSNRGRNLDAILAACLYIACRQEDKARSVKEICSVANGTTKKEIVRANDYIMKLLEREMGQSSRFCSNLGMSNQTVKVAQESVNKSEDFDISTEVVADQSAGDTVCSKCGPVLESTVVSISNGVTSDSNDGGLSTVISKPNGITSDLLSSSFKTIATMSDRLGLVATINDRANEIYKKVEDKKSSRGRNLDAILAACLYIACRQEDKARSVKEICSVANGATKKEIVRANDYIMKMLEVEKGQSVDFMRRSCSNLGMTNQTVKAGQESVKKSEDFDIREVVADHSVGDRISSKCGLVLESTVVSKPNGVTSDDNDGGLSAVISVPNGVTGDPLSSSFKTIATMSDRLGLVATINDRANEIYKKVEDKKSNRGRNLDAILAACLYIACRQEDKPRSVKEICSVANGATKKEIVRANDYIMKLLEIEKGQSVDFMRQCCSNLGMTNESVNAAQESVKKSEEFDIRRSPISIAAAVIYIVTQLSDEKKTLKDVSLATGVAEGTVRNTYKSLYPHLSKIIPTWYAQEEDLNKNLTSP